MLLSRNKQKKNIISNICEFCSFKFPIATLNCSKCNSSISKYEVISNENHLLTELAIEHALLKMGTPELELVKSRLKDDYDCNFANCLEHPEYLKTILRDLFGNCYYDIVDSINASLTKTSMEKPITVFLSKITVHV